MFSHESQALNCFANLATRFLNHVIRVWEIYTATYHRVAIYIISISLYSLNGSLHPMSEPQISRRTIRISGPAATFLSELSRELGRPRARILRAFFKAYVVALRERNHSPVQITVPNNDIIAKNHKLLLNILNAIVASANKNKRWNRELISGEGVVERIGDGWIIISGEKYYVHRTIEYLLNSIDVGDYVHFDYIIVGDKSYKRVVHLYPHVRRNEIEVSMEDVGGEVIDL